LNLVLLNAVSDKKSESHCNNVAQSLLSNTQNQSLINTAYPWLAL